MYIDTKKLRTWWWQIARVQLRGIVKPASGGTHMVHLTSIQQLRRQFHYIVLGHGAHESKVRLVVLVC
jgi:hypothetical protein